ncbi:uncharacterized protein LOC124149692 [Haliotis rufescens]|uniref:uncharacterized protein LOC124149692 n=1 Tax=Haliotis rufescens TaxID=6454 RepID=UPI00201ED8A2|nr:uncharacterized protein LOC124149692 [Haliotis rufescens]
MDTGNLTRRLLNTSSTSITGGMFETTVNETTSFEQTKKLVYVCGDKSSEIACEDRAPPIQKVPNSNIVIPVVVQVVFLIVIYVIAIIIFILRKRKNKNQKAKNPDPQLPLYYADACVHYATVDDLSVPETKTMKQVLNLEMVGGVYSLVADRRAADKGTQGDDTATTQDTGYSETVEDQQVQQHLG